MCQTSLQIFAIGALAKLGATVTTYPLLLVKSRLMSTTSATEAAMRYRGTWDALSRIFKEDGSCFPFLCLPYIRGTSLALEVLHEPMHRMFMGLYEGLVQTVETVDWKRSTATSILMSYYILAYSTRAPSLCVCVLSCLKVSDCHAAIVVRCMSRPQIVKSSSQVHTSIRKLCSESTHPTIHPTRRLRVEPQL